MGKQPGFYVDLQVHGRRPARSRAGQQQPALGVNYRRVVQYTGGDWVQDGDLYIPAGVYTYYVSVACMHCANPLCGKGCPTGAMYKGRGRRRPHRPRSASAAATASGPARTALQFDAGPAS